MTSVKERDLQELFGIVVENLKETIRDNTATAKDKEVAMKILEKYQIGIELDKPEHSTVLDVDLPFDEMNPIN